MCYSAQVQADYKKYVTMFGAEMSIREFYEVFYRRGLDAKIAHARQPSSRRGLLRPADLRCSRPS